MVRAVTNDGAANVGAGDSITAPTTPSVDFKSMSDEDFAAYEAGRKRYGELAAKSKAEAGKKSEAQFVKDYGSYLYSKPMEEFKPSQETAAGFAALGSLMMVAGSLFGGKGRLAGIGAMNNIAGMIKGYQSGRKDLYEQERQQFEENMKVQERNRADIKEAFNLALKMAPTDLRGAEEFMGKVFMSKGMNIPHEMMKTSGFTHTASVVLNAADKADQIQKQVSNQIGAPSRATGLPPINAKLTQQQEIELAQETARRAARSKEEKGAQEWVNIDGKIDRMTRQEVDSARAKNQNVQYIPTPVASQAVDPVTKIGQGIGDVLQGQTEEGRAAALKSIKQYGVVAGDEKLIPVEVAAIRQAERTATNIANNPEAIGVLATVAGKVGEPTKSIMQSLSGIFSSKSATEEEKIANARDVLDTKANQVDKALDDYATANPAAKDQVRQAKIIGKELFSLALADAVAVGRPTVFLERALSTFYSPNVRPEVLIEIIKTRALDGNEKLPKVFRQDTWQVPSKLLQTDSAEAFMKAVTGQQAQPAVTPVPAAPANKKPIPAGDVINIVNTAQKFRQGRSSEEGAKAVNELLNSIESNGFDISEVKKQLGIQ